VPNGCGEDTDGCPDFMVDLGPECRVSEGDAASLRKVAEEINREPRFGRLRVVGSALCGQAVDALLVHDGVAAARLEQKVVSDRNDHGVYFEVAEWDHTRCP
jgi:hypothetical protein